MSFFSHLEGNDQLKSCLERLVKQKTIPHSLLFVGPECIEKSVFAEAFAKCIICSGDIQSGHLKKIEKNCHPDLYQYQPEGKIGMHSMDAMRQFTREVYLPPYEAEYKVFVIQDAERMLSYSSNALLKTLEEPASKSIIILLSAAPQMLLPTIRSRCFLLRYESKQMSNEVEPGLKLIQDELLHVLSKGRILNYTTLMKEASSIGEHVEELQKAYEEQLRLEIEERYPDGMNAVQQQVVDKEIDGCLSMKLNEISEHIFYTFLSWYRDMHVLQVNGKAEQLINSGHATQISQALQRGEILCLDKLQKDVSVARLSLARSTSLTNCLENLFLAIL